MLQSQFLHYIKNPSELTDEQGIELESILHQYPFFATSQLLLTKLLHQNNSVHYSKQLRKTALVANSRQILFELIHTPAAPKQTAETHSETLEIKKPEVAQPITEPKEATSSISVTNNDIKVIYVNTVPNYQASQLVNERQSALEITKQAIQEETAASEIDLLKEIENNTQNQNTNSNANFNEDKLNQDIENEIHRGVVTSYVQSEIIKTPQLDKEEEKEPVNFTDWLQKIKKEAPSIQKIDNQEEKDHKSTKKETENTQKPSFFKQNIDLIDKIIESDPGRIKLSPSKFFSPATDSKQSLIENEHLVTETLAKIYALQGNISKAIRAYEILSLKFPQKSVYFASLIENLKKNK